MGRPLWKICIACVFFFVQLSCIKNDIPYPVVELSILEVSGTGFTCSESDINLSDRTVIIHLDETTDISKVYIESVAMTDKAVSDVVFPGVFDMRSELHVNLELYQTYTWTIRAEQNIARSFRVEGQIGESVIDPVNFTATAKVPATTDMSDIKITELKLGPEGITEMFPPPEEITVFETYRTVDVKYHDFHEKWRLYVIPTDVKVELISADIWTRVMWLSGSGIAGTDLGFSYRKKGDTDWIDVPDSDITVAGGTFTACVGGLEPNTEYQVKAYSDDDESETVELVSGEETPLPNAGFEEWSTVQKIVYPYAEGGDAWWGTGNPGASMASITLTDKNDDIRPGSSGSFSARLDSKFAGFFGLGKLASGNLFTGKYVATRGTDGIVGFGRPFTMRPTALKGWIKYNRGLITDVGKHQPPGMTLSAGDPDKGIVYIALGTWTPEEYGVCANEPDGSNMLGTDEVPICVDTRDLNSVFNSKSPAVVGYGEMILEETVSEWQEFTIKINYNAVDVMPTHIVIVCTSSMYGDYYIGSRNSTMWIDDFELFYDKVD